MCATRQTQPEHSPTVVIGHGPNLSFAIVVAISAFIAAYFQGTVRLPQARTNRFLDALPTAERAALMPSLDVVALPLRTPLFGSTARPRYVHFLTSGLASTVSVTSGQLGVETGIATRNGFPEALHLLGPHRGDTRCFMQVEGSALRMDYTRFQQQFAASETIRNLVLGYVQADFLMIAQLVACNALHNAEQRLARWLLMVADRLGSSTLQITQEFLADMVGARRSTVTVAAGSLQRRGLIEYSRGLIRICDRKGLQLAACECYAVTHRLHANLYT
jgi:hypothetical protein